MAVPGKPNILRRICWLGGLFLIGYILWHLVRKI